LELYQILIAIIVSGKAGRTRWLEETKNKSVAMNPLITQWVGEGRSSEVTHVLEKDYWLKVTEPF
jgi:hypothetical protein